MTSPTFIGIGAKKCGTTWLSECLRSHPDIFMTAKKEIHFFGAQPEHARPLEWYLAHFEGAGGYKAVGEFSPSYLLRESAPEHMMTTIGAVKIVVMLRDPIQRFISDYKQLMRTGELPKKQFSVLDSTNFSQSVHNHPKLLQHGNYYTSLKRFVSVFGPERICVVIKEDVDENPLREIQKVYEFLGVNQTFIPPFANKTVSLGIVPRFMFLETLRIRAFRIFQRSAPNVIVFVRKIRLAEVYRRFNADNKAESFRVRSEVIERLKNYYREEITALEEFLGRTLESWGR